MIRLLNNIKVARSASLAIIFSLSLCFGTATSVNAQAYSSGSPSSGQQSSSKGALGLVINWNQQGRLVVVQMVPSGPAARAGVSVGDLFLSIDGHNVQGLPANQVFSYLLGSVGTTSVLKFNSPTKGTYEAKITRVPVNELKKSAKFNIGMVPADQTTNNNSGQTGFSNSTRSSQNNQNNYATNSSAGQSSYGNSARSNWNTIGGTDDGYSLRYPNGWTASQNGKTGRIEVKSPAGSKLSIFPFFLPSQSINVQQAQGLFQAMLKQYAPGPKWSAPAMIGGGLRAMSTSNNINSIAGLALANLKSGTNGRLIIFQVPNNSNSQNELTQLSQILNTFTITGGTTQNSGMTGQTSSSGNYNNAPGAAARIPQPNIQYTKFVDPKFSAFSLDVPVGWNVTGEMSKPMRIDLRPWVKAVSPNNNMMVFMGDNTIRPRYMPASWLNFMGCYPGTLYKKSDGLVSRVTSYQKADKFLKQYVKKKFGSKCESCELVNIQHHPELNKHYNNIGTPGVVYGDVASATYRYKVAGKEGDAFFLAATKKGRQMWWVSRIYGVVANDGYGPQAMNAFLRMYTSWVDSPQFLASQAATNVRAAREWIAYDRAARARSAAAFRSRMAAMDARHEAFRSRMAAMDASHSRYMNQMRSSDRAHSNFINFIRDEDTLMNPSTGTKYQVEYGPKYHWVNSAGDTTIGTDSAWSPGADWTELVAPPR